MAKRWMIVAVVVGLGACSSTNLDNRRDDDVDGAAATQGTVQCRWPEDLNGADGRTACIPARVSLSCHDPAGDGCGCTTDGGTTCDCSGLADAGPWTCTSTCAANQYIVSCGGVGPGPVPGPPEGCTFADSIPAGIARYCCPCQ